MAISSDRSRVTYSGMQRRNREQWYIIPRLNWPCRSRSEFWNCFNTNMSTCLYKENTMFWRLCYHQNRISYGTKAIYTVEMDSLMCNQISTVSRLSHWHTYQYEASTVQIWIQIQFLSIAVLWTSRPERYWCFWPLVQWNLSVTTTSKIKFITCHLFNNVF